MDNIFIFQEHCNMKTGNIITINYLQMGSLCWKIVMIIISEIGD